MAQATDVPIAHQEVEVWSAVCLLHLLAYATYNKPVRKAGMWCVLLPHKERFPIDSSAKLDDCA